MLTLTPTVTRRPAARCLLLLLQANTMLFELLVTGVIRDVKSCRVYRRRAQDAFALEIPNSIGDKTAARLAFSAC